MGGVNQKAIGIAVLFVAFLLGTVNSIARTSFTILDTDSTTYIIIVMLMIFPFIAFYIKEDLNVAGRRRDIAIGAALFVAYVAIVSYLRAAMSFAFATYRIDGIMFPLLLASLVITIFGLESLKRFNRLMIYSVFASPLLLMPLILANGAFANFNADIVYSILRLTGVNAAKSGIAITGASSSTITIASTCVPIGIFIATVMLLLPLAYLYRGRMRNKAIWIGTAVIAVLLMNILRMAVIALAWAHSGIGSAISLFHIFAGEIIFYIAIVLFVLLAGKFGLTLRGALIPRKRGVRAGRVPLLPIILALVYGALIFVLTMPYGSMLYASPAQFSNAYNASTNPQQLVGIELGALAAPGYNVSNTGSLNPFEIFTVRNTSTNSSMYVISGYLDRPVPGVQMFRNTTVRNEETNLLPNGISLVSATYESNGTSFYLDYLSAPYMVNGSEVSVNYEVFVPSNASVSMCRPGSIKGGSAVSAAVDSFESSIYNAFMGRYNGSTPLCYSYEIAMGAT